ncbi:MAG: MATE family efflux transporter [Saprospiraceae bacterium]|nr:MATE family efflux transporter [Lewinella sp.]
MLKKIWKVIAASLRGEEQEYTSGSINKAIILLSIPMILEMAMESLFALVDAFFVAQVSADAMATVGLTESVITLVYAVAIGISTAPTAMIARFVGEKDENSASRAAKQAIYLALFVALALGIPGFLFADDILRMMGGSEALIASGVGYTRIMFGSNVVIMLLFLLNGIFRGAGDAAHAMRALWIANLINIALDPLFIFGVGPFPELGVQGAAVATTIGRSVGVAYQLFILFGGRSRVRLLFNDWALDGSMIRRLGRIAATGAGQYIIGSASWIFLMRIIARFGSEAVAGYTISIRLIIFTLLPAWGLSNAAATLVGQNLGAKQPERAETSVWRSAHFTAGLLAAFGILYVIFSEQLILAFDSNPAVLESGIMSLRIFGIGYLFFGYGMIFSQAFNGAGDTRTPTLVNLVCFWLFEIPFGYFLAVQLDWGLAGVCWAVVITEALMSIMCLILFKRGRWKLVEV